SVQAHTVFAAWRFSCSWRAFISRRHDRPLVSIWIRDKRFRSEDLSARLAQPRHVVLLQPRRERVHVRRSEMRDHSNPFRFALLLKIPRLVAQKHAERAGAQHDEMREMSFLPHAENIAVEML